MKASAILLALHPRNAEQNGYRDKPRASIAQKSTTSSPR